MWTGLEASCQCVDVVEESRVSTLTGDGADRHRGEKKLLDKHYANV